jgi:hypothetical protein
MHTYLLLGVVNGADTPSVPSEASGTQLG